jgi:hypothetical protein
MVEQRRGTTPEIIVRPPAFARKKGSTTLSLIENDKSTMENLELDTAFLS